MIVRGHLTLEIEGLILEYSHQSISSFGVAGLPWAPLHPNTHYGRVARASIVIPGATASSEPIRFRVDAIILKECTVYNEMMAIKFNFPPEDPGRERLQRALRTMGRLPTEHIRKYPRIPSQDAIQTFPLRAVLSPDPDAVRPGPKDSVVFEVENLSPNGVLVATENALSLHYKPADRVSILLEPRGWFPMAVRMDGMICRTLDDVSLASGNQIRRLGIKFSRMDEVNRTAFMGLLKDVLERIRQRREVLLKSQSTDFPLEDVAIPVLEAATLPAAKSPKRGPRR